MQEPGTEGTVQKACIQRHKGTQDPQKRGSIRSLDAYTAKPSELCSMNETCQYFLFSRTKSFKITELILEEKLIC